MDKKKKLYKKAVNSPTNLSFYELCFLAEAVGFEFRNQTGSHRIYKHLVINEMINIQPDGNKAKPYQVKQLLKIINKHGLKTGE